MNRTQQKIHRCPLVQATVTLRRQIITGVSGIGNDASTMHADHSCSKEDDCPQRDNPVCEVKRLNQ